MSFPGGLCWICWIRTARGSFRGPHLTAICSFLFPLPRRSQHSQWMWYLWSNSAVKTFSAHLNSEDGIRDQSPPFQHPSQVSGLLTLSFSFTILHKGWPFLKDHYALSITMVCLVVRGLRPKHVKNKKHSFLQLNLLSFKISISFVNGGREYL